MTDQTVRYTVDDGGDDAASLWRSRSDSPLPVEVAYVDDRSSVARPVTTPLFRAAAAVLAPDDVVRQLIYQHITNTYYSIRNEGGSMDDAAVDARDAVLGALFEHATGGGNRG